MVNNLEFSERLKKVMEYYNLTATALADSITIQRSSISHLLSGRNKPSLDFVMKVLDKYPTVELYWLLNGKGDFPKTIEKRIPPTPSPNQEKVTVSSLSKKTSENSEIDKIVVFYKNGTFKSYLP
jgi:transcriptional regulator with XRE-family HTH domain